MDGYHNLELSERLISDVIFKERMMILENQSALSSKKNAF